MAPIILPPTLPLPVAEEEFANRVKGATADSTVRHLALYYFMIVWCVDLTYSERRCASYWLPLWFQYNVTTCSANGELVFAGAGLFF